MVPEAAVMYVVEEEVILRPVAKPLPDMVATLVFDEIQVAASVITTVLPSSNVAVATNCCVSPEVIDAVEGVTSIDFTLA